MTQLRREDFQNDYEFGRATERLLHAESGRSVFSREPAVNDLVTVVEWQGNTVTRVDLEPMEDYYERHLIARPWLLLKAAWWSLWGGLLARAQNRLVDEFETVSERRARTRPHASQ